MTGARRSCLVVQLVPLDRQIFAIETEIATLKARITARMGDLAYKQQQDCEQLVALQAAAESLRTLASPAVS